MGQGATASGIAYSTAEDVERIWINPGQEYSHRVVTTRRQGAQRLSVHVTTYAPGFEAHVEGDGHYEVVMFCISGGASVTPAGAATLQMAPGGALYLPLEFSYDLVIGADGMTVVVACTPPKE
jgi:uncharacterized RmlC-like cupin family protein